MNIIKAILALLIDIIEVFFIVSLVASVGISFPANAQERGGITVIREVPQRSAIRPSVVPGQALFVDTSPDDNVIQAINTDKLSTSIESPNLLNELDESAFAKISTNTPQNIHIKTNNIASQIRGSNINSNLIRSTQRLNSALGGAGGAAIGNSIGRATSRIGRSIRGATGFLTVR